MTPTSNYFGCAGLAFVVLTDPTAIEHAWHSVFG
jgi:hypothetical protein